MNKALLFSIVSVIGVIGFSMAAAVVIAPQLSAGVPASPDTLLIPGVLVLAALMCAVAWRYFLNLARESR